VNLRDFVDRIDDLGELRRVSGANTEDEIGALAEINARGADPTAMLFDDIPGYRGGRVLSGTLSSPRRLGEAFGLDAIGVHEIIEAFRGGTIRRWIEDAGKFRATTESRPTELTSVPCTPEGTNVESFPAPRWHPLDGGRYIGTGGYVLTMDPDGTWVNAGGYRLMTRGPRTLSLWMATSRHGKEHLHAWWKQGKPCPVVAVLGDHPLVPMLSGVEVPGGVSEMDVAGAVRGEPIATWPGELTGIPIPVTAELAMEGFVHEGQTTTEGPFGEGTGYYAGGVHTVPAIDVERIYHRADPIVLGAPPGKPPHDYEFPFSVIRSGMIQDAVEASGVGGIQGVWTSFARSMVIISVKQAHPGHSRQAAMVAGHCGPGAYMARYVIAVDDDIDPTDLNDVLWAVATRADPATAIELVRKGWGSPIDPLGNVMEEGFSYNSRAIIDACVPYTKRDVFPPVAATDPAVLAEVAARFADAMRRPVAKERS
jgi:UbiD family decarboxylase